MKDEIQVNSARRENYMSLSDNLNEIVFSK